MFVARLLVFFQFSSLFLLMFSDALLAHHYLLLFLQVIAAVLGLWAVYVMQIGNFNITPTPVKNAVFKSSGPYEIIRHPMYTSLLLFTLPELIDAFSYWRLLFFIILSITLVLKMKYEERNLMLQFQEYKEYRTRTYHIIPYVY